MALPKRKLIRHTNNNPLDAIVASRGPNGDESMDSLVAFTKSVIEENGALMQRVSDLELTTRLACAHSDRASNELRLAMDDNIRLSAELNRLGRQVGDLTRQNEAIRKAHEATQALIKLHLLDDLAKQSPVSTTHSGPRYRGTPALPVGILRSFSVSLPEHLINHRSSTATITLVVYCDTSNQYAITRDLLSDLLGQPILIVRQ